MVDLHTHILPHIDDGAKNKEESIKILESLKEQGVDKVVLTPHFNYRLDNYEEFLINRERALEEIKASVPKGMELFLGAEVYYSRLANNLEKFAKLTICDTKYILIELPFRKQLLDGLINSLENIANCLCLTPIIAHVEKYPFIQSNPEMVCDFISRGFLIQGNADSLLFSQTKRLLLKLLEKKQIYCLGSDTHNPESRQPRYDDLVKIIKDKFGEGYLNDLQKNMENILSNKDVVIKNTKPVKKVLWFYV